MAALGPPFFIPRVGGHGWGYKRERERLLACLLDLLASSLSLTNGPHGAENSASLCLTHSFENVQLVFTVNMVLEESVSLPLAEHVNSLCLLHGLIDKVCVPFHGNGRGIESR